MELFSLELEKIDEFDFYTVASTNINQSASNMVEMYVTVRSRMIYIMDLVRTEHLELSAFELETAIIDFVYARASANKDQSAPNMAKTSITNRSQKSLIMNPLGMEPPEFFALELGKLLNLA